jgi:hypothetical protein
MLFLAACGRPIAGLEGARHGRIRPSNASPAGAERKLVAVLVCEIDASAHTQAGWCRTPVSCSITSGIPSSVHNSLTNA